MLKFRLENGAVLFLHQKGYVKCQNKAQAWQETSQFPSLVHMLELPVIVVDLLVQEASISQFASKKIKESKEKIKLLQGNYLKIKGKFQKENKINHMLIKLNTGKI